MSQKSKALGRGPSALWACSLLALSLTAQAARGQTPPAAARGRELPSRVTLRTTPHRVRGRLRKGRCEESLSGWRLRVAEHWYVTDDRLQLVRPQPNRGLIVSTGAPLEQGRALAEVTLTDPGGDFDVSWREVAFGGRVPWRTSFNRARL
jgi:hypothetical protein